MSRSWRVSRALRSSRVSAWLHCGRPLQLPRGRMASCCHSRALMTASMAAYATLPLETDVGRCVTVFCDLLCVKASSQTFWREDASINSGIKPTPALLLRQSLSLCTLQGCLGTCVNKFCILRDLNPDGLCATTGGRRLNCSSSVSLTFSEFGASRASPVDQSGMTEHPPTSL